jgi:hypothetical protein
MKQFESIQRVVIAIAMGGLTLTMEAFSAPPDAAVIVNSGSTNKAGFRIVVERSGNAEYTPMPRRPNAPLIRPPEGTTPVRRSIPDGLVRRLYSDLDAAKPLSSLPQARCAKSASFGFRLTIEFGGLETPDLSCGDGDNPKLRALIQDANEIGALFTPK